ncbi:MAG: hypothetical protein B6I31_03970 [Desulfobacteraceae bacterium 4572_19]|nr:MAG: hypothetical protein B6I31_03970 [Desulfobacteraceae bacterium 4572_19]
MNHTTIGIIGGAGAMGCWFEKFFSSFGYKVLISDLNTKLKNNDIVQKCDVIILSTPIDTAIKICKEIGPILKKNQLLMDVCSQKEDIVKSMLECGISEVIGVHPMFGPFTESLNGQNIIVVPARVKHWSGWLEGVLEKENGVVTAMDAVDHDKHMALVQGLTHFLTVCMGRTMQKMNMKPEDTVSYSTPIFRLNCELLGRMFAQDLDLYATLIGGNKYVKDTLDLFQESMEEVNRGLLSSNHNKGVKLLNSVQTYLGDYCEESLEKSNDFLKVLFSRYK